MFLFTSDDFREMTGTGPEEDDLDRLNCVEAGMDGHRYCGFCDLHKVPRFICACQATKIKEQIHDQQNREE